MARGLAWAAGFADGEGCFSRNSAVLKQPKFIVGQKDPELLFKLHGILGVGKVYGPYRRHDARLPDGRITWREMSEYSVATFEGVQAVLAMLWPWLGETKRRRAIEVLMDYRNKPRVRRPHPRRLRR